jgi:hypothetical protein
VKAEEDLIKDNSSKNRQRKSRLQEIEVGFFIASWSVVEVERLYLGGEIFLLGKKKGGREIRSSSEFVLAARLRRLLCRASVGHLFF